MSKLEEADKKLKLSDFLLSRPGADDYLPAILNHILKAANLAVSVHFKLDDKSKISPLLIQKQLENSTSEQEKEFSNYFLELWKMSTHPRLSNREVLNAHRKVKAFVNWVKLEKEKLI